MKSCEMQTVNATECRPPLIGIMLTAVCVAMAGVKWPCRQQQPCRKLSASTRTAAGLTGPLQLSSAEVHDQIFSSHAATNAVLGELGEGLEAPVQLLYLITLLGFVVVGAYLVVRQVQDTFLL